jgi:hypothetical protein
MTRNLKGRGTWASGLGVLRRTGTRGQCPVRVAAAFNAPDEGPGGLARLTRPEHSLGQHRDTI